MGKRIGKNPAFMYDTAQTVVYTGQTVILIMTDNKIIMIPVQAIRKLTQFNSKYSRFFLLLFSSVSSSLSGSAQHTPPAE